MNSDTDKARMLNNSTRFPCACCQDDTKARRRRAQKRRERQALREFLSRM